MIKKLLILVLFAVTAQLAYSEDATHDSIDFGFGVDLVPSYNLYLPIPLDNNLTIEPFLSYYSGSSESGTDTYHYKTTYSEIVIGLGLYKSKAGENVDYYYGGRFGFVQYNKTEDYKDYDDWDSERSYSGFLLYPVVGAEYFFTDHFSLAGEIHPVHYHSYTGTEEVDDETGKYERTSIYTQNSVMVRWYY